jgi:nickel/cobalt transporter (NicO) family protein
VTRLARGLATLTLAAIALLASPPAPAAAHPLGNFTVNLYSALHVVPREIRIDYVVDMAEIPTFQEMASMDGDGDGDVTSAERQAWAGATATGLAAHLIVSGDGERVGLEVRSAIAQLRPGQGGLRTLRFEGVFVGQLPREGRLEYSDGNFPGRIGWREITAVGEGGVALAGSSVPAMSVSDALLAYPQDLLTSPLDVRSMAATFRPGASAPEPAPASPVSSGSAGRPGVESGALAGLVRNHGLPLVVLGLALALAFGAWHALLPGHGKTLMAAYMVGSSACVRQAVAVGAAVAIMHTASVLALGLLVLTLERAFRPEALYPWLGLLSGLVAVALGAHLMMARLAAWSSARRRERPRHGHIHERPAEARAAGHPHGWHGHGHSHPDRGPLSRRGLVALALAGGILPAPSALLVMLAAINAHRLVYGLALVLTFSAGLAAALIVVGIGALRARDAVSRRLSSTMGRLVPVLSAAAIVVVGAFLAVRGVAQV